MTKYIKILVLVFVFTGCMTSSAANSPELDSPIVFGDVTPAPWGCMQWQKSTEIKGVWEVQSKCCPLEPIVPPTEEEPLNIDGWVLKGWDC
jgi:hypothetical protein